ncbi:hypothetical protein A4A49_53988 [Nicotiana attenuata]|uniref:Uncharacterized protein n=1 Tax=Nicotiana attenuata TaxID=49451 RepID=A0A1J6HUV9_NICAT|nr:hypothetical protein A4A49_53988 [Nicotiana attenuata]
MVRMNATSGAEFTSLPVTCRRNSTVGGSDYVITTSDTAFIQTRLDLNRSSDSSWFSEGDCESHRMGQSFSSPRLEYQSRTLQMPGEDTTSHPSLPLLLHYFPPSRRD